MDFWSCRKNNLVRKVGLISKFMTSQPGKNIIAIHILYNISRSKGNQTITFGQITEYNVRNFFLSKIHAEDETGRLVSDLFLFFKQALDERKASGLHLSFNTSRWSSRCPQIDIQ